MLRLLPLLLVIPVLAEDPELPPWPEDGPAEITPAREWPELDPESRPWLRWRWPASGELPADAEAVLKAVAAAGFGGVEVVPEGPDPAMLWPDPAWIERCRLAAETCAKLGMGFDLATQRGAIPETPNDEGRETSLHPVITTVAAGPVDIALPEGTIDCLGAWPRQGAPIDLSDFVDLEAGRLIWEAPPGTWRIFGAIHQTAGRHLDPFSPAAAIDRLDRLDEAFLAAAAPLPRARTLERTRSTGADWSRELVPAFRRLRGYDLREELPALFGDATAGTVERLFSDYRETLDDLRYETLLAWHEHTRDRGSLTRSLLAGGPGHPLDVHAVADIPGTLIEINNGQLPPVTAKFAASAAHLTYKPIVQGSFRTDQLLTPALLKRTADHLWLAGANQLILDGRGTGGIRAPLDPGTGLWRHLPAFTAYVDRCQSVLQTGAPDPDLLLYFPAHDFHVERDGLPDEPVARSRWLEPTGFHRAATDFDRGGVDYDIVSDRLLRQAVVADGRIILGGLTYTGIVLPEVRRLPETTATKLLDLARAGARIGILGEWPRDVPGLPSPDIRRGTLVSAIQAMPDASVAEGSDAVELAERLGVTPEPMTREGLHFVRRSHADGHHYFVVHTGDRPIDEWIPLARPAASIRLLDPRFPERSGFTEVRQKDGVASVRLQLDPGESRILRTYREPQIADAVWKEFVADRDPLPIAGTWNIDFLEGGPVRPDSVASPVLGSWKTLADPAVASFTGVARYTIEFELPDPGEGHWQLDLGGVAHSAEIHLNGLPAGIAFAPPHRFDVGPMLKAGTNTLSIRVANLLAPGHPELPAGLLGPVRLIPLVETAAVPAAPPE
ncbi:glycosyl hydrolase [Haloferula sp. A504]|uniref:glycosyl hydrolase n=1 Tax=Haloferula sp. A504 TaxID=3373601 RepID=UPI0031BFF994|nr:hypothetical protein [Verrucomicrobiaceae bacterium E54]